MTVSSDETGTEILKMTRWVCAQCVLHRSNHDNCYCRESGCREPYFMTSDHADGYTSWFGGWALARERPSVHSSVYHIGYILARTGGQWIWSSTFFLWWECPTAKNHLPTNTYISGQWTTGKGRYWIRAPSDMEQICDHTVSVVCQAAIVCQSLHVSYMSYMLALV